MDREPQPGPQRLSFFEYIERTPIEEVPAIVFAHKVPYLPNTYAELRRIVAQEGYLDPTEREMAEELLELIGSSSDPDAIVQQLPFSGGKSSEMLGIHYVLPQDAI